MRVPNSVAFPTDAKLIPLILALTMSSVEPGPPLYPPAHITLTPDEATAIAGDLGVTIKDVMEMEKRMHNHDLALEDNSEEDNSHPSLYLKSNELEPDQIIENNEKNILNNKLYKAIDSLDERSKDIMKSRWLSENKLTLEDLSKKYDVSRERIRQIENETMLRLKENL